MPEVRRLLALLPLPAAQQGFGLHWSRWRRRRQAEARRSHYQRRFARPGYQVPLSY